MRIPLIALGAVVLLASGAQAKTKSQPKPMTGIELAPMAKVSLETARTTALKSRPGTITDQELEKEAGGTGLRYSFDIKNKGKTYEVGVDAKTGKILENKAEGPHPD